VNDVRPRPPGRNLQRRSWRQVDLVSLDFEATGLDFQRDKIISFGAVPIRNARIDIGDAVYQIVDPEEVPPSPESIVVHGLRAMDLAGAPSIDVARRTLRDALDGRFLVTWWAPVEAAFLDRVFGGGLRSWRRRAIDVRELLIALEGPSVVQLTLSQAAERFDVPVASPHNALDDALVTAQLFLVVAAKLPRRFLSVRDLQRLQPSRSGAS
jgi:DNA polymerase-3 subunit epsilon